MKVLVAIPCYNCAKQISRVYNSLNKLKLKLHFDTIFIDNQSQDNTKDSIQSSVKNAKDPHSKLLINESNYGLGGSHKVAFSYAIDNDYDFVVMLHGDDQASSEDIPFLLGHAKEGSTSVLGSRFMKKSRRVGYQKSRTVGNMILNIIFTCVTLKKTLDLGSGLNIFKVSDLKKIDFKNLSDSFNFNVELLLSIYEYKINYKFLPISWTETDQISNAKNFDVAIKMLKSLFRWRLFFHKKTKNLKSYTYKKIDFTF